MINALSSINLRYLPNLRSRSFHDTLSSGLKDERILISFYGDSNVGKSTLLNAILGNRLVKKFMH